MKGFFRSIRVKLTITTVIVMGAILTALGFAVYFGAKQTLLGSVDSDILHRAINMTTLGGGPPHPPGDDHDHHADPLFPFFGEPPHFRHPNTPGLRPVMMPVQDDGSLGIRDEKPVDLDAAQRAAKGWSGYSDALVSGQPVRLYTKARIENGRVREVIQVPYELTDIIASLSNLRSVLLTLLVPLGAIFSGLASLFLVDRLLKPLRQITSAADEVSAHSLSERLPISGDDEFAKLARTLNAMLARIETTFLQEQDTLRQLEEAIALQRRFTADASHELKTPLAVVKANTGLVLHMEATQEDYREAMESIDAAADRMSRLVADLLVLARADAGHLAQRFQRCNVGQLVEEAVQQVPGTSARVTPEVVGPEMEIDGSANDLTRVFVNLIDNAMRYSSPEAPITVHVERQGGFAAVKVRDNGPGIAPEHLEHLFERFYRVDKSRTSDTGGTGLGLAICKGVVNAHGGQISVSSQVNKGTTFTILLPLAA